MHCHEADHYSWNLTAYLHIPLKSLTSQPTTRCHTVADIESIIKKTINKKHLEKLIAYFPLINGRLSTILLLLCVYRWRRNVSTEPLPSNDKGMHIQTHRLMRGIYEVRHWDGLRCNFHNDWFGHPKVEVGEGGITDIQTQTARWSAFIKERSLIK
jgi:hypothetical protein